MSKSISLLFILVISIVGYSQTFETERGGYYFFSPIKHGFIGMSTVSLNLGIGEYVSSGNTITTYSKTGSITNTSNVDCKDALTGGLSNENNDYSYLLSYFINSKNSIYKLVLYQVDKEGDLDRISINLRGLIGSEVGRGSYVLDLKYATATSNACMFVFSKYQNNIETFYLTKVGNKTDKVEISKLDFEISDEALKSKEQSALKFVNKDGGTLAVIQLVQKGNEVKTVIKEYTTADLKLKNKQEIVLDFLGKEMILHPSTLTELNRTFETYFPSVIYRDEVQVYDYLQYEYNNSELIITGLYMKNDTAIANLKADGLFTVNISSNQNVVAKPTKNIVFNYGSEEVSTPYYLSLFGDNQFYYSLFFKESEALYFGVNEDSLVNIDLKNAGPEQAIIYNLYQKDTSDIKYFKTNRSKLYQTGNSYFCLYGLRSNSTGLYTTFSFLEFIIKPFPLKN